MRQIRPHWSLQSIIALADKPLIFQLFLASVRIGQHGSAPRFMIPIGRVFLDFLLGLAGAYTSRAVTFDAILGRHWTSRPPPFATLPSLYTGISLTPRKRMNVMEQLDADLSELRICYPSYIGNFLRDQSDVILSQSTSASVFSCFASPPVLVHYRFCPPATFVVLFYG